MKTQRPILVCLLLVGVIVASVGFALPHGTSDFGNAITTDRMANMFGGGYVWCGDTDCDTASGGCPGGDTCNGSGDINNCYNCKSGAGQTCGSPGGAGWQCVSTTESCNGTVGSCAAGMCEDYTGPAPNNFSCGTRPDC